MLVEAYLAQLQPQLLSIGHGIVASTLCCCTALLCTAQLCFRCRQVATKRSQLFSLLILFNLHGTSHV